MDYIRGLEAYQDSREAKQSHSANLMEFTEDIRS